MKLPRSSQSGVALVITLFFLVIVTVVVVAFLDTARMDRTVASSHLERMRATTFAQSGVESVVATLQRETGDPPYKTNDANYVPRNWISQPGAIVATDSAVPNSTKLAKIVPLSSGQPTGPYLDGTNIDFDLRPTDLNIETLVDQSPATHLLTEQTDPATGKLVAMKVRWVYVRQDGTLELDASGVPIEPPVVAGNTPNPMFTNTANPIVGRYAYWADDESAKVNYNLAWTRNNTNTFPAGHPTKVNLEALPGFTSAIAGSLHNLITTDGYLSILRFYNSPFDARQRNDSTTRAALDSNKFNLTHFNNDPDTTYYGRSRMMLTAQLSNAVLRDAKGVPIPDPATPGKYLTRPFLDILKNPTNSTTLYIDPGIAGTTSTAGNVDAAKLNTVVKDLVKNYLQRTDWPMVDGTGHSIQEKYYSAYNDPARTLRLAQLALNIIDYTRSAESKLFVAQPIRAKWLPANSSFDASTFTPDFINQSIQGTDDTFKGLTRQLHITELGMWVSDTAETAATVAVQNISTANIGRYHTYVFVEVYLPTNYGNDTLDLMKTDGKKWTLYVGEMSTNLYYLADGTGPASTEYTVTVPRGAKASPTFIWEAKDEAAPDVALPSSKTKMAAGEYRTFAMEVWRTKSKTDAPNATLRSAITVTGGPRIDVAPLSTPLSYSVSASAAFETQIPSFETADPRVNGLTKDWIKVPKGSFGAVNSTWLASLTPISVTPPQDLDTSGQISTASMRMPYPYGNSNNLTGRVRSSGELGLIHTGIEGSNSAPKPGVSWRSLRLQPSPATQLTSVVPDWAFMDLFTVPADVPIAAAGLFAPHSSSTGGRVNINAKPGAFDFNRIDPLTAVFYGARKNSTDPNAVLTLPEAQTIAQNVYNHTLAASGKNYPAILTNEPKVYESPGEIVEISGVADQGESGEELVREIANLVTARGNVFSIYTVGQALKQTPAGKLLITAEQRQQAMVERYLVGKGTADPKDDEIHVRTIYSRNLIQ